MAENLDLTLQKYIYDPNLVQLNSLNLVGKGLDGTLNIPDPTNPFIFLLENSAKTATAVTQEITVAMRNMYPYLATNKEELYHHITNDEINDVFATPSKARFNFFINKKDLEIYGDIKDTYTDMILPKYTTVTIKDTVFTLVNDLFIRLYKNKKVFAKFMYDELDISYNSGELVNGSIINDNNGVEWIMLDIEILQVKKFNYNETLIKGNPFVVNLSLDDNEFYTYLNATTVNVNTNEIMNLNKTYSNFVYDPNIPTINIKPDNNNILIEVPTIYTVKNMISSYINITLFTTLGKIELPLTKYDTEDFTLHIELPVTDDPRITGIKNINYFVNAGSFTYGGRDEASFDYLKEKVITHSTGDNKLPITKYEINDKLVKYGFNYLGTFNTIFEREFLVNKTLKDLDYDIYSNIDEFYDNVDIFLPNLNTSKIKHDDFRIVIEPYQFFKYVGDKLQILTDSEMTALSLTAKSDLISYNENKHFFNLYKYVLDNKDGLTVKAYDVNQPLVSSAKTSFINDELNSPLVIIDRVLTYGLGVYTLEFYLQNDAWLYELDSSKLFGELSYTTTNGSIIYFKGYVKFTDLYYKIVFELNNDSFIGDDGILFSTTEGVLKRSFLNLVSEVKVVFYSLEDGLTTINNSSMVTIDKATTVLYEENVTLNFATKLDYLFTNYKVNYTERKFLTYEEDVYLTYKENVYELDRDGTIKLNYIDTDGDGEDDDVELVIKYNKGDFVLDANGDKILLYKKGSVKLDDNNKPLLDVNYGIIHNTNLLLIEDIYLRVNNEQYSEYKIDYFKELTNIITDELSVVNNDLLDNTYVKYIAGNNIDKVVLNVNYVNLAFDNFISPEVIMYVNEDSGYTLTDDVEKLITLTLQEELLKKVTLNNMENVILNKMGPDVISIKVNKITPNENITYLNYVEGSSRFIINKKMIKVEDGSTIVRPDVKIVIIKI